MTDEVSGRGYAAARGGAGVIDRARGRIVVSGRDRRSYLQGLLTNDIVALGPGQGCYAAYLTPQGRMIADLFVYELGDVLLLTVTADITDGILAKFDQFVFSEDVAFGDVTATFGQVAIVGPDAAALLARTLDVPAGVVVADLPEHGNARAAFLGQPVVIARVTDTGEPGFDLFVDRTVLGALVQALFDAGASPVDAAAADALRIEAGVPLFHRDMDEETIPLEAGIEGRAISFSKGCYVGQEVIIRVLHRGHGRVARKLVGLLLEGAAAPAAGTVVRAGDREVGHVTSAVVSPALRQPIALAYVLRDFVEPGTDVVVDGAPGRVTALPFVTREASRPGGEP